MQRFNCVAEEIRKQADKIRDRLFDQIKEGNPVIFGAGDCGHRIYDLLHGYGIQVLCFCDNGMGGGTDEVTGLKIIRPEELYDTVIRPEILVCVGDEKAYRSIIRQLFSLGFDEAQIHIMNEFFYWHTWQLAGGRHPWPLPSR